MCPEPNRISCFIFQRLKLINNDIRIMYVFVHVSLLTFATNWNLVLLKKGSAPIKWQKDPLSLSLLSLNILKMFYVHCCVYFHWFHTVFPLRLLHHHQHHHHYRCQFPNICRCCSSHTIYLAFRIFFCVCVHLFVSIYEVWIFILIDLFIFWFYFQPDGLHQLFEWDSIQFAYFSILHICTWCRLLSPVIFFSPFVIAAYV